MANGTAEFSRVVADTVAALSETLNALDLIASNIAQMEGTHSDSKIAGHLRAARSQVDGALRRLPRAAMAAARSGD